MGIIYFAYIWTDVFIFDEEKSIYFGVIEPSHSPCVVSNDIKNSSYVRCCRLIQLPVTELESW